MLVIGGEDRLGWLHSMSTQYLTDLPGGTETLFLSPHGHVEHHAVVLDDGTATYFDVEPGTGAGLLDFLNRMRFLMRVSPELSDLGVVSLVGPATDDALSMLGVGPMKGPDTVPVPGPKFAAGAVPPRPTTRYDVAPLAEGGFVRRMPYGADLLVPRERIADLATDLPVGGLWAFEALRVEARRPRLGFETDHRTIPAEVGWLAPAVHLDKGCYRGQETIARVHNLGRPPRHLVLLHLDGASEELPPPGTPVTLDGRPVGFSGTAVRHHELGQVALAVVKRNVPPDARLSIGDTAAAIDPG